LRRLADAVRELDHNPLVYGYEYTKIELVDYLSVYYSEKMITEYQNFIDNTALAYVKEGEIGQKIADNIFGYVGKK